LMLMVDWGLTVMVKVCTTECVITEVCSATAVTHTHADRCGCSSGEVSGRCVDEVASGVDRRCDGKDSRIRVYSDDIRLYGLTGFVGRIRIKACCPRDSLNTCIGCNRLVVTFSK
jgi:hypothetical protein